MTEFIRWLLGIHSSPDWIATYDDWSIQFQSPPEGTCAAVAVFVAFAATLFIWWLYRREGRSLGLAPRLMFFAIRSLILVGVAFMLLEMVLVLTKRELAPSNLAVLVDTSESMSLKDPYPDEAQARQLAARLGLKTSSGEPDVAGLRSRARFDLGASELAEIVGDLADRRVLWRYGFAATLDPLTADDQLDKLKPAGPSTGIGTALSATLAAHRGQPMAGILLVTDGRNTSGEDPLAVAAEAAKEGVPIHVLAVGTDDGPRNVRLAAIEANKVALLNDPIEIGTLVESRGFKDATATVVLEERQDDGSWREIGREQLAIGDDTALKKVAFRKTPDSLGQIDLRARVIDAGPELDEADNVATTSIRVVRERIRVLVIAGYPSPEVQFLRNALLRDTGLELATWLQNADAGYQQIGHRPLRRLPANQEELDHYDMLILFDPDMRKLGSAWPDLLTKFVGNAGGGLVFVAGEVNSQRIFNPDPGDATNLSADSRESWVRILPVVRDPGLYQSSADVRLSSREIWALELTADGASDAIFQFDPANPSRNREVLASLPGMYWHFPVTRAKVGAKVLAQHGDPRMRNTYGRHVLLATQRYGPGHTVFLGFDSTYRWRYLHEAYFDGFWARLIDRVGRDKLTGGGYPFRLLADKAEYRVGDRITVRAELLETTSDSAISELHGEVTWGGDTSIPLNLEPQAGDPRTLEASFVASESGTYTARFVPTATADEDTSVRPATLSFNVAPPQRERDNPTWDRSTLEKIALTTGGRVFTLANTDEIPAAFRIREVERILEYRDELWDAPILYGSVLLLLTLEWILRKRFRMA
jgi:hypothetical protein